MSANARNDELRRGMRLALAERVETVMPPFIGDTITLSKTDLLVLLMYAGEVGIGVGLDTTSLLLDRHSPENQRREATNV